MFNRLENIALRVGRLRQLWRGEAKGVDAPFNDQRSWLRMSGPSVTQGAKPETKGDYILSFTSWVYVCAKLNAMSCGAVPLELYAASDTKGKKYKTITTRPVRKARMRELKANGSMRPFIRKAEEVEEVTSHAFLDLMQNVNPFFNSTDLMELTILDMDLTGEAYWYVVRGKAGQPVELWPVPSMCMKAMPGKTMSRFIDHYEYRRGKVNVDLSLDEVIDFRYANPANYIQGMSCVKGVVDAVYSNTKMTEYEEALFANKARTGGVFQAEADVAQPDVDRMREDIDSRYSGNANAGRPMLLPPGVTWAKDSFTNEEMSFIEGRRLTREEVCAGFDVPVALLDPEAIRANVDGAQYFHAKYGIAPRLRKIEEKVNERLLPMFDDSGVLFCAFENPVPDDKNADLAQRQGYVGSGIMAINEARADMGLEAVDGGDAPLVGFNLVPLGQAGVVTPADTFGGEDTDDADTEDGDREDSEADDNLADDAEKLADMTLAKIRERLGVK